MWQRLVVESCISNDYPRGMRSMTTLYFNEKYAKNRISSAY